MADTTIHNITGAEGGILSSNGKGLEDSFIHTSPLKKEFIKSVGDIFDELKILLLKKHIDYGPKNISDSPGGPINGLRVRMHDKLARINNLVDENQTPNFEAIEDSFKDMANYAIIGLLVLRNEWDN